MARMVWQLEAGMETWWQRAGHAHAVQLTTAAPPRHLRHADDPAAAAERRKAEERERDRQEKEEFELRLKERDEVGRRPCERAGRGGAAGGTVCSGAAAATARCP